MDISALDKAFSENINSVKYTDSKKSWKVSDRITIDWRMFYLIRQQITPKKPQKS